MVNAQSLLEARSNWFVTLNQVKNKSVLLQSIKKESERGSFYLTPAGDLEHISTSVKITGISLKHNEKKACSTDRRGEVELSVKTSG